ncbi:MAG: T9SS type A sorting domain-containing protein [Chitinophagaceae bacterium]|nr:T9SS type A sorting domain-containing protein [Chitinophagaceae bacterium]
MKYRVNFFLSSSALQFSALHGNNGNAQYIQHNWPLNQLSYKNFQWGARQQYLLSKIKYSDRDFRNVLFNAVDNFSYLPIETEGVPASAYHNALSSISISLLRTNMAGVYDWIRISGGSTCYAKDFETDSSENFIVLADNNGNAWDSAFHFPLLSNYTDSTQLLLFKADTAGKISWFKLYGGSSAEYANCIKRTSDGNFLVLASTQSGDGDVLNYQGGKDIWLLKINGADGSILWQKTFGSLQNEIPYDMEILPDESIVIAGAAEPGSLFPDAHLYTNAFLMKLDNTGNIIWKKTFGGNGDDMIRNFIPAGDGGFACVGTTNSVDGDIPASFGGTDVFVSKHGADGSLQWIKMYGNSDNDKAGDVVYSTCDSTIFVSYAKQYNNNINYSSYPGFIQSTGVEIGLYNNGNPFHFHENNFAFPASSELYNEGFTMSMAPNTRGGFLGASITHDVWTPAEVGGGYLYTRSFDFIEYGVALQQQAADTTLCSGSSAWGHIFTSDTVYADTLRNACGIDTLIRNYTVHISTDGSLCPVPVTLTSFTAGSSNKSIKLNWHTEAENGVMAYSIQRSENPGWGFSSIGTVNAVNRFTGNLYSFTDSAIQPGVVYYYRLQIIENTGLIKYSRICTARIWKAGIDVAVYPNPAKDFVTLELNHYKGNAIISLVNNAGQVLQTKIVNSIRQYSIDVSLVPTGNYWIIVRTDDEKIVKKVTKL